MAKACDSGYASVRSWLRTKRLEGRSERTVKAYAHTANRLGAFLGMDPKDATTEDVRAFLAHIKAGGASNVTINNNRRNLNSYFAFLEDEDVVGKSPMRRIHHVKEERRVKEPFTDVELELMVDAAKDERERAIITLLASTGCRVGELVGIRTCDIDLDEREIRVVGKGNKERYVFMDTRAEIAVRRYLRTRDDDCPYLIASKRGGSAAHACTVGRVEAIVRDVGARARVPNVHPHRFRRTVATRAIERGMPIEQVKELLGHSNIQTTTIYAVVSKESVKASHRRYVA